MIHCPCCNLVYCRCPTRTPAVEESSRTIFDLVKEDLDGRDRKGRETYGGPLMPHDGRDSLWDLYEELLDACMYIRKAIRERDGR